MKKIKALDKDQELRPEHLGHIGTVPFYCDYVHPLMKIEDPIEDYTRDFMSWKSAHLGRPEIRQCFMGDWEQRTKNTAGEAYELLVGDKLVVVFFSINGNTYLSIQELDIRMFDIQAPKDEFTIGMLELHLNEAKIDILKVYDNK